MERASLTIVVVTQALITSSLLLPCAAVTAAPGEAASAPQAAPHFATVTADNVYVRSGPSVQSSYPFGKMDRGDVVRVMEENFGWARVQTGGRAFSDSFGYVTVDDRVQMSTDGATITASAVTEVRAPNISTDSTPESSWKQIARLEAGATLPVVQRIDTERGSVWSVRLPESGEGWINSNFLRRATADEVQGYDQDIAAPASAGGVQSAAAQSGGAQIATESVTDETLTIDGSREIEVKTVETAEAAEAAVPAAPAKTAEQIAAERRRTLFAELEGKWLVMKGQSIESAELTALYAGYMTLAAEPALERTIKATAAARLEQIEVQQDVQERIAQLKETKARLSQECEQINGVASAIEARSEYTAVGVLNASIVYDGKTLPLLFRLQDPASGQTVAYVTPGDGFQLSTMVGTLIGVKGDTAYDDALKLDTITPRTIDFLSAKSGN
jgi:SH3-like domain-containing protein